MQAAADLAPAAAMNEQKMKMKMHMSFFWGTDAEILFHRWPGGRGGMYAVALLLVFALALLVELLSDRRWIDRESNTAAARVIRTLIHALRVSLSYVVMLAVMSFNVGVLLVAVGGHGVGFLLFGSKFLKNSETGEASNCSAAAC